VFALYARILLAHETCYHQFLLNNDEQIT
jgi:hypothetical protein